MYATFARKIFTAKVILLAEKNTDMLADRAPASRFQHTVDLMSDRNRLSSCNLVLWNFKFFTQGAIAFIKYFINC